MLLDWTVAELRWEAVLEHEKKSPVDQMSFISPQ